MEYARFNRLKAQVAATSARQILQLEDLIRHIVSRQISEMALARRTIQSIQNRTCPHCSGDHVVLHGRDQNKRQRFKCRGCQRTYNIMTGTPMARTRKPEKWGQDLGCMTAHMSVRKILKTGIGLHQVTVWRWRHRFLKAVANETAAVLSGVIEADKTFFLRSFKGSRGWQRGMPPVNRAARQRAWGGTKRGLSLDHIPVLTALDNSGAVFETILVPLSGIEAALDGRIAPGSVLCSDGSAAYVNAADKADAEHYTVPFVSKTQNVIKLKQDFVTETKVGRLGPGGLGLGRVRGHHQRLADLINGHCLGVATKYLSNYLGWHRAMIGSDFEGKVLLDRALR